ncbi:MAG TPA: hypothetical protein PLE54_17525 [Burkholderiaceae bacterium]|nr:hypothetical protein [Burkholderiaceae bacterium]HQR72409.1 hypothetical protein [Burkholderiaceae bacterium]
MTSRRPTPRVAVVAGATGLVGSELLRRLQRASAYGRIVALTRRPLGLGGRIVEVPAQFDALADALDSAVPAAASVDAFCCLGTTLRKAGSQAAFRHVDFDCVVAFGRWAARRRARRLVVISALGADAGSRVFYNRIKGEAEDALRALAGQSVVLLRPSLLDGRRSEWRVGEFLALALTRPWRRLMPTAVRPVAVADVAQSMLDAALQDEAPAIVASAAMHGAAQRADARAAQASPMP